MSDNKSARKESERNHQAQIRKEAMRDARKKELLAQEARAYEEKMSLKKMKL